MKSNKNWKVSAVLFLLSQNISLFGSSIVGYAVIWHRPKHRTVGPAPELPDGQGRAGAVGHGVVLAQAGIGVDLVLVSIIDQ